MSIVSSIVDTDVNSIYSCLIVEVVLTAAAADELDQINNPVHARILKLLVRLEKWPEVSGVKALRGDLVGKYRLRTGDYRLQFFIVGSRLTVEKIGHRDGFYEDE